MPPEVLEVKEASKASPDDAFATSPTQTDDQPSQTTEVTKRTGSGKPPEPKKTPRESPPPPTPNPPFKIYSSTGPSASQYPNQLIKWWGEIPKWAQNRLIAYVYRDWPILVNLTAEEKKAHRDANQDVDDNYIDKISEPFKSVDDLFDRYGSGDYHFILGDVVVEKRNLATAYVRESWRDFRSHPPVDRRIDKVENLDMAEKTNASYIAYLRSKGKLPDQQKMETNMAEATAVSTVTGILGQVVNRVMDDKKNNDNDSGKGYASVIGEVMGVMKENMPKQESPLDNVDKMVGILDRLRPVKAEGSSENGLLSIVIASISENSKQMLAAQAENAKLLMQMQNERIADMRAMVEALKPSANPNPVTGTPVAPAESAKEYVKELLEMASVLGLRRGGAAATEAATGAFDWKAQLPDILDSGGKILGTLVRAWEIKSMMDARAANPNAPIIVQAPQPQVQAPAPQTVTATGEPVTESDNSNSDGPDPFMLQLLVQGFLNHFKNGWGGDTFAEWLIAGTDQATYENLKSQGSQALTLMLNQIPVTAQEITGKEALLTQFIDEFMRAAEIRAAQDAEDEAGEGGEEPPEEIPVPAVNGPAKVVRTVKPKAVS